MNAVALAFRDVQVDRSQKVAPNTAMKTREPARQKLRVSNLLIIVFGIGFGVYSIILMALDGVTGRRSQVAGRQGRGHDGCPLCLAVAQAMEPAISDQSAIAIERRGARKSREYM